MKLYELTDNYLAVLELAEESDSIAIKDTLDSIESVIDEKAENIAKLIKSLEATEEALKNEIQRLQQRKTSINNNIRNIKDYLQSEMERSGKMKIKGTLFNIGIQNNPPSLKVVDEKKIPLDYFIEQEPKLDKALVKEKLRGGEEIEGAEMIQTKGVRIR